MKDDLGNDSPQHSYESHVSGHSTPIRKKEYVIDIEDSPELNYRCSPISMPCTQDGGNEIAWDWQTPVNKNSYDKSKSSNKLIETPKRTKQLQKKRNSNSPLLQKPLKRKQVKMENIENIGKLTAELKALNEKMQSIQKNNDNDIIEKENDTKCEVSSKLMIELDSDNSDEIIIINNDKSKMNSITINSNNKNVTNYEDLFDDSIDDSMVKCSQEIEEKLNLCKSKRNDIMELSIVSEIKELSSTSEKSYYLTTSNTSTEYSKSSNISKNSSTNTSGYLKTYSNKSNRTNSNSNISMPNSKFNNNNNINISHENQTLKKKHISDFPDDSFDDCLATCIEDDKLESKLSEYDFSPSNSSHNTSLSKKIPKLVISNAITNKKIPNNFLSTPGVKESINNKNKLITDDLVEEVETITDIETLQNSFPSKNSLENRKFFRTKSLSDQCFYQCKYANTNNKTTNVLKSNAVTQSVSTKFSIVKNQNSCKNNNFLQINGMENTHRFKKLDKKETDNHIVKYNSTNNLLSMKEIKESQSIRCTPEEIERKRLEAKMKLEAKRKLQQKNIKSSDNSLERRSPGKKYVKR